MKKLAVLGPIVAFVALASVSGASTNLNLLKRITYSLSAGNSLSSSTQPTVMATPTITICKTTFPTGGTGFPFSWSNPAGSLPSFSLNDNQCATKSITGDHYNEFAEHVPSGWTLTNITCNHTTSIVRFIGANSNPGFQPGDNRVTIDLNEPNVTCTFTNNGPAPQGCCLQPFQIDLSTGQGTKVDAQWKVNGASAYITTPGAGWMSLPPAKWIQQPASGTPSKTVPAGLYKYTIKFVVPTCPGSHVQLNGSFAADNSAVAFLDGSPISGATCPGPNCFNTPQGPIPLNLSSIIPGTHTLEIDVTNDDSLSYSGLLVKAVLTRQCP